MHEGHFSRSIATMRHCAASAAHNRIGGRSELFPWARERAQSASERPTGLDRALEAAHLYPSDRPPIFAIEVGSAKHLRPVWSYPRQRRHAPVGRHLIRPKP